MVFSRKNRRSSRNELPVDAEPPNPPPPNFPDVWNSSSVFYYIDESWNWVMEALAKPGMTKVPSPAELPSQQRPDLTPVTPATRRRRNATKKVPTMLKIEILDESGNLECVSHGTCWSLDGVDDKDELVRTMQRCRCDHLNLSPPSVLLNWDVTHDECINVVGEQLPTLDTNTSDPKFAVLKEPMGSQGQGIYFVKTADEILEIVQDHRKRASEDPNFLDDLIEKKGRIPSFVLQAEVHPSLLVKDHRKFIIRTYVVVLEAPQDQDLQVFIFNRHEVRIAGVPVKNEKTRDTVSHITNGALSTTTERVLLDNVEELKDRQLQTKTEAFVAALFDKHLRPEMIRGVMKHRENTSNVIHKFSVAGLDLMVTADNRLYLLEVNNCPAAPKASTVDDSFRKHLCGFCHDLVDLVVGKPSPNFLLASSLVDNK